VRKLTVFNHVSLDGYFTDRDNAIGWVHVAEDDPEWTAFTKQNVSGDGELVFGRKTYDMMASFWPTPAATREQPEIAAAMNGRSKVVFSRALDRVDWSNSRRVHGDPVAEIAKLKEQPGPDLVILGSGSIIARIAAHELIDRYQIVVNPVVLGAGRSMFEGAARKIDLRQTGSRAFRNGKVLLAYEPA